MRKLVLTDAGEFSVDADSGLCLDPRDIERVTGWHAEAEGLCKDGMCVPAAEVMRAGRVDAAALWRLLGHPVVHDEAAQTWVLGSGVESRLELASSGVAPDFELPDTHGIPRRLSSLRGMKVLLVTWAPWCGCRTDLPVWQALFHELRDTAFMVVAVAQESRGADRVRPWVEAAGAAYWCLVDEAHRVSDLYGLVNVPQAVWIDETGRVARPPETPGWTDDWRHNAQRLLALTPAERKQHGFMSPAQRAARDAGRIAYTRAVTAWVREGQHALTPDDTRQRGPSITPEIARAHACFRLGLWLRAHGQPIEGDRWLAEAGRRHPDSWTFWRQAAELEEIGKAAGPEFLDRLSALGDKCYYPPPDLPGFSSSGSTS